MCVENGGNNDFYNYVYGNFAQVTQGVCKKREFAMFLALGNSKRNLHLHCSTRQRAVSATRRRGTFLHIVRIIRDDSHKVVHKKRGRAMFPNPGTFLSDISISTASYGNHFALSIAYIRTQWMTHSVSIFFIQKWINISYCIPNIQYFLILYHYWICHLKTRHP